MRTVASFAAAAVAAIAAAPAPAAGAMSIGAALPNTPVSAHAETTVFEHPAGGGDGPPGYLSHFWATGAAISQDAIVRYYVDHESVASVEYRLLMGHAVGWLDAAPPCAAGASGSHWPTEQQQPGRCDPDAYGNGWMSGGEPWDAGGLFGKTGARGGLWNSFKVPFQRRVHVTVQMATGGDSTLYVRVGGVVNATSVAVGDAAPVSMSRHPRLVLVKTTAALKPYEFVRFFTATPGRDGMVWLVAMRVESGNRHFTEGCTRVYDAFDPGARSDPSAFSNYSFLLSSGVEDYFDSAYHWTQMGWPVPTYHGANAGLTHWNLNPPSNWSTDGSACSGAALPGHGVGHCRLAAYKTHLRDHLVYSSDASPGPGATSGSGDGVDGGTGVFSLAWRNGEPGSADVAPKCGHVDVSPLPPTGVNSRGPADTNVTFYAWAYEWDAG